MAYRRSYGSNRDWTGWHTSQLQQQSRLFGGVDDDVRLAFLGLSKNQLQNFLFHYERRYGATARSYAEKAFPTWKVGTTRMSAQTTERLLSVLPPFLGHEVKCSLLRKLRENHRTSSIHNLTVTTVNYRDAISPVAKLLIAKAYNSNLPIEIVERLKWLSDSDSESANELMAGAEAEATALMFSKIDEEFTRMHRMLVETKTKRLTHKIELPYGILNLTVTKGEQMDNKNNEGALISMNPKTGLPAITSTDQLLKSAIQNLTPEQLSQISHAATQEALNLQVEAARADQRHVNAAREIDTLIDTTKRLQSTPEVEFRSTNTINTASGTTTITVSKDKSKIWIIVAIALGVLVLLLVLRK